MRSRSERPAQERACAAVLVGFLMLGSAACPAAEPISADRPTDTQIAAAVQKLKEDPNLVSTRKVHVLHSVGHAEQDPPSSDQPAWVRWIANLFAWLAEAGRMVVWAACAVVAGLLAVYLIRTFGVRRQRIHATVATAPTHVRDLDIRPESLPDDIGAAARELWDKGDHRAALALLYRGSLSRLAHAHGVPIRHSTTEGESVELAARHLRSGSIDYISKLVRVWQRAVYRGEEPQTDVMIFLCDGFAVALDPTPALSPAGIAA